METADAPNSASVAAVGMEHVRLSYIYLDAGDVDGYMSLLSQDVVLRHPGRPPVCGVPGVELTLTQGRDRSPGRHVLDTVFSADRHVVALGRLVGDGPDLEFADIYRLTASGLLVSRDTYFFAEAR